MASTEDKDQKKNEGEKVKRPKAKKLTMERKDDKSSIQIKPRNNLRVKKSALEDELKEISRMKLESQKQQLKEQLFREVEEFDNELQRLKEIKYQLQSDLNLVEMKILTYSQQFIIFRDMQTYDLSLMEQLQTLGAEKTSLQSNYLQLTTQISEVEELNE